MKKKRLDLLLLELGLVSTRSRARGEIMAGHVYVDGKRQDKAGSLFSPEDNIELRVSPNPFVSRGGLKLQKALLEFEIKMAGKIVLDIGASTGGFTHCSLLYGAEKVYALDVGHGQLDLSLRRDSRVINIERRNARLIKKEEFPESPDLVTMDVSFISLALLLPVVAAFPVREIICLIKPQFEAAPSQVGKNGVVKDPLIHREILLKIMRLAAGLSYEICGLTWSPLKGPKGNIEYLLYLKYLADNQEINYDNEKADKQASATITAAFLSLNAKAAEKGDI